MEVSFNGGDSHGGVNVAGVRDSDSKSGTVGESAVFVAHRYGSISPLGGADDSLVDKSSKAGDGIGL